MSYYNRPMGDYRTGGYGYPSGDPGLFSFLGKIIKPIVKFVKPLIFPAAVAAGTAVVTAPAVGPPAAPPVPGAGAFPGAGYGIPAAVGAAVGGAVAGYQGQAIAGGVCPAGYHPRKDRRLPFKCVRNRRMNIANPRALRRGMRRVKGFEKLARRTISFTKRVRIKS